MLVTAPNKQWSLEETKCLAAIWASREFQEKLEGSDCKTKLYEELADKLGKAGLARTPEF